MFSPLSNFNANRHQQHQHLSNINIPTTTAASSSAAAAASLPVVPAKRKRANTSIPAQALQQQHQHQHHLHQQPQYAHLNHLQQPTQPTLAPRSYSAYPQIQQHPPTSTTSVVHQTPGSHHPIPPSSSIHIQPTPTAIQHNNINGNVNAGGGSAPGSGLDDIHCICGYTDDDGYTIACDDCQRWSHMVCFDISVGKDPPEWRCWECDPRPVNYDRARDRQAARVAAQRRLGPFVGTPEAEALAQMESRQRKRRDRKTSAAPGGASAPPLSAAHSGGGDGGEDEHIDIEEDWKIAYVHLTEDLIPQASTRTKLRIAAQNWRGVTALSSDDSETSDQRTKVVPVASSKEDAASAVRPPSYSLQTTGPIANDGLIAPLTSTIIPSAQYFADPLNGYAQMGLPKPHVHLVPPPLSVALDARMAGNEARFIRSGCRPNAVLRPVLCPSKHNSDNNDQPGAVKFAVFALRDLKASEEVVLGWEWDDGAVVHQLPALIEEGMRSGAGPSKMTPHHIERLRLQMQSIVESLKSSFVTCACGSAASDCAVRLMEMFADGGIPWLNGFNELRNRSPKVPRNQNNAQAGPSRPSSSQAQASRNSNPSHSQSPSQPSRTFPSINRHGASVNEVEDRGRYLNPKVRAKMFGPLVGAERGVRTRLVGGPDSGGLMGVQQVNGDRWDRFGQLDVDQDGREGSAAPELRVERRSPAQLREKLLGKGKARGPNGVGVGCDAQSPSGFSARQPSPLRSSLAPGVGSSSNNSEEELPGEVAEEKMPPRMRKKWIQKRLESLRREYPPEPETSEGSVGLGLSLNRSTSPPPNGMEVDGRGRSTSDTDSRQTVSNGADSSTPTDAYSATSREQTNAMDVDIDTLQMPPPPPPTAVSGSSATSPRSSLSFIPTTASIQHPAPAPPRTQGRSSLFSLLNDQPVSPIHSSRYLAQIMNPAPPPSTSSMSSTSTGQDVSSVKGVGEREPEQVTEPTPEPRPPSEPVEEQRVETFNGDLEVKKERFGDDVEQLRTFECDFVNEPREPEPIVESDSDFPGDDYQRKPAPQKIASPAPVEESAAEEESVAPSPRRPPSPSPSALSSAEEETEETSVPPRAEEVKEVTPSPASPTEHSASREPTPTPIAVPVRAPSHSPTPVPAAEITAASSPLSPSPVSTSVPQEVEIDKARSTSPAPSAPDMEPPGTATHAVHDFTVPAPPSELDPAMLFKEELEEIAAAGRTQTVSGARDASENVEDAQVESEDESEVKMMVDHSPYVEHRRSVSSPISSLSTSDRKSVSVPIQSEQEKDRVSMEVDDHVDVKVDSDEEMHDVHETLASSQYSRVSPTPPPAVEVQQPSPSPPSSEITVESPVHSPVVEKKSVTPEPIAHEEKQTVLAAASVPEEPVHAVESTAATNQSAAANDAQLLASPNLLRAPSPTVSVGSSAAIRPSPPPFAGPSDTEHEHETDTDRVGQSRDSSQVQEKTPEVQPATAPAAPSEPQKIRRSMADYRQRKRKQREEEAARAALMSPTSPASPLQQDTDATSATGLEKKESEQTMEVEQPVRQNGSVETSDLRQQGEPVHTETRPLSLLERIDRGDRANREVSVGAGSSLHAVPSSFNAEANLQAPRQELSPKREVPEDHANFSPSPIVENKVLASWKFDADSKSHRAPSPPLSPGSVRSKGRPSSPPSHEDGEILNAPLRSSTPPSAPRADAMRAKVTSESPTAPSSASTFTNSRIARAPPPTQPRSYRDERRIPSMSPPPRHPRDSLPPPSSGAKSKLPGWASRERQPSAGLSSNTGKDASDKDKRMDNNSVRRASSYVPPPPSGPSASTSTSGLRGPPPSGPRALRGPPPGPARVQGPPVSRIPLSERVERDRSRDRGRDIDKDRDRLDRDREREREREYDRYSPPRGRYAGRVRPWGRGRR